MIRQALPSWRGRDWPKLKACMEYDHLTQTSVQQRPLSSKTDGWGAEESSESLNKQKNRIRHVPTLGRRSKGRLIDREFFLSVLNANSTKREAKSYLARFKPLRDPSADSPEDRGIRKASPRDLGVMASSKQHRPGVNLGDFYLPSRAVDESPLFIPHHVRQVLTPYSKETLHLAVVKIRTPQSLDELVLYGVAHTLSQLRRLGLSIIVVIDCDTHSDGRLFVLETDKRLNFIRAQADRIVAAIDSHPGRGGRRADGFLTTTNANNQKETRPTQKFRDEIRIAMRRQLLHYLARGIIPVIPSIAYAADSLKAVPVAADDVVLALAAEMSGKSAATDLVDGSTPIGSRSDEGPGLVSLDRIILLDPLGGIPSRDRSHDAHVFINMEQEFRGIRSELMDLANIPEAGTGSLPLSDPNASNAPQMHLRNLELLQRTLAILPPSSSALLTTPDEAANSGQPSLAPFQASGVGTRRQRNPLIHNLLTDKPIFSSSLPPGRLGQQSSTSPGQNTSLLERPTTFIKWGMPLTILPPVGATGRWEIPNAGLGKMTLHDPCIDLSRLIHLIEDSFNRKLDVEHYLNRVNHCIAGVIIAGDYEGGAILTWELPPGVPDDDSAASRARLVPYLDKFAVLKRSQGAGGVADIVFKAMVNTGFPNGVCWRSRRDNPVNKWYFERAKGTWKMVGTNWTMFWTTEEVQANEQLFLDYESVCRAVMPSWADKDGVLD